MGFCRQPAKKDFFLSLNGHEMCGMDGKSSINIPIPTGFYDISILPSKYKYNDCTTLLEWICKFINEIFHEAFELRK